MTTFAPENSNRANRFYEYIHQVDGFTKLIVFSLLMMGIAFAAIKISSSDRNAVMADRCTALHSASPVEQRSIAAVIIFHGREIGSGNFNAANQECIDEAIRLQARR